MTARLHTSVIFVASLCTLTPGCSSLEEAFKQGRAPTECLQAVPACPGLLAACTLDNDRYTRLQWPKDSPFLFLVEADANAEVTIHLFFVQPRDAGFDTRIWWNEPGCSDAQLYQSEGRDLFDLARPGRELSFSKRVRKAGEHLIEIVTDMRAEVLVAVSVDVPTP